MHIFFSVGEPSGDHHAAGLIHEIRQRVPTAEFTGFGGPYMEQAGCACIYRLTELAVMGIGSVLPLLGTFFRLVRMAGRHLDTHRPDAVVLVDYPGFNWWIAAAAKKRGIPVYFYCPPQLWAWAPWRIRRVRRLIDCVLAVLPFEAEWYRKRGANVEYVGHPYFDEIASHEHDREFMAAFRKSAPRRVALLPGSRKQEVRRNFPIMVEVVRSLMGAHPDVRFAVACYKQWHFDFCEAYLKEQGADLPIDLYVERTAEILRASDCSLMVSGSVSLELLAAGLPAVVQYRCGMLMYFIGGSLKTCRYISLPNLIADRELMPEFVFAARPDHHARKIARRLDEWLSDPSQLEQARADMTELRDRVIEGGGLTRAAETILARLGHTEQQAHAA